MGRLEEGCLGRQRQDALPAVGSFQKAGRKAGRAAAWLRTA